MRQPQLSSIGILSMQPQESVLTLLGIILFELIINWQTDKYSILRYLTPTSLDLFQISRNVLSISRQLLRLVVKLEIEECK